MKQTSLNGDTVKEVGSTYVLVKNLLKLNPPARDSDSLLIRMVESYCKSNHWPVPAHETITRCRRKVQNDEGKYLPSEEIALKRRTKEKYVSNALTVEAYLANKRKFEPVDLDELKKLYPKLKIVQLTVDTCHDSPEDWYVIGIEKR